MKTTWTKQIPWDEVLATLDALADAGWEKDAALDLVSKLIDDALPMDTLVPGPAGHDSLTRLHPLQPPSGSHLPPQDTWRLVCWQL